MKNILYITLLTCLLGSLCSCDSYLDEVPDSRISITSTAQVSELLTNAYSKSSYLFTDGMTDDVSYIAANNVLEKMQQLYRWQVCTFEDQDTPAYYWSQTYNALSHANQALQSLAKLPNSPEKQAALAEAYLTRAYGHFMLVNVFGKHYNPATSSQDLGVPYITEPEDVLVKSYRRKTVAEVYDLVEKDMLKGLQTVDNSFYKNTGKYHFTKQAALAFASRFYLYKKEYDQCIKYSNQLLGSNPSRYIRKYADVLAGQGPSGIARVFSDTKLDANLMLIRQQMSYQLYYGVGYRTTPTISLQLFLDFRNRLDKRSLIFYVGNGANSSVYPPKHEPLFQRASLTSSSGIPYSVVVVFRGEEVLLNKLEALSMQMQEAKKAKNTAEERRLRAQIINEIHPLVKDRYNIPDRGPNYTYSLGNYPQYNHFRRGGANIVTDSTGFVSQFVQDEKRREFVNEGLRWFDIKRRNQVIRHTLSDGTIQELDSLDSRKAMQIPAYAITNGLKPNTYE